MSPREYETMESRIGGFNFQWAWASGFIAGSAAGSAAVAEAAASIAANS